jgi:amino acid transporter
LADAELRRGLKRLDLIAITLNIVVGAGVFTMPAALAAGAGSWSLGVLLFTIVLAALLALCTAEVASRYDVTGGPLVYARSAFGPAAGFVIGWLMYLSRIASFGAIAVIMLDYAAGLMPLLESGWVRAVAMLIFVAAVAGVNLRGIVQSAVASNVLTAIKLTPLVLLAVVGIVLGSPTAAGLPPPAGLEDLGRAVLVAFFACMGFEVATVVAGESRSPRRDVPLGMLGGTAGVAILYTLVLIACLATVPNLGTSQRPLADAAAAVVGSAGATAVSLTAIVSCAAALLAWMVGSPRVLFALAAQGDMPRALAAVDARSGTPHVAIIASAVLVGALTLTGTFVYLASFAAAARLLMYGSTCAALITLRRRDGPAPLAIPFGPWWAVVALASTGVALAATIGTTTLRDLLIAVAVGLIARTALKYVNAARSTDQCGT